jgi:hypothetical protein
MGDSSSPYWPSWPPVPQPPRTWRKVAAVVVAVTVILAGLRIGADVLPEHFYWQQPDEAQMSRDAASLQSVLPGLQELGVTSFLDQRGCKAMDYALGSYSTGCGGAVSFTDQATADFGRVEAAFRNSGVWVWIMNGTWGGQPDRITHLEFDLAVTPWQSVDWQYVYDEGGSIPDSSGEFTYTRIDAHWYFSSQVD